MLILIMTGWWQSGSSAAQVQVPMFYDAHYLFPRAWTQEQAAPGIPPPAYMSLFADNRISQTFVSGSERLSMLTLWLSGETGERVDVSLVDDNGETRRGDVVLTEGLAGDNYVIRFDPFEDALGRTFRLTMAAPDAGPDRPVVTRSVGGDRLEGSLSLNEYNLPGNLQLQTYADGLLGRWWLEAVGAQVLPYVFRQRLSQYKPEAFKGAAFSIALMATGALSILYLVLARPGARPSAENLGRALGWATALVLTLFLLWQVADRRLIMKPFAQAAALAAENVPIVQAPPAGAGDRLVTDLAAILWTAERFPEERFVHAGVIANRSGIKVPADSRLEYGLTVLPASRLRLGVTAQGEGDLRSRIRIDEAYVESADVPAVAEPSESDITWLEVDLSPWSGQAIRLVLETEGDKAALNGWWVMPQIMSSAPWLKSDPLPADLAVVDAGFRFADLVELVGYTVEPSSDGEQGALQVSLYWRPLADIDSYAKIFVHLLDAQGELVSQSDGEPVDNAYPLPLWQPGTIIEDVHLLELPPGFDAEQVALRVGLYAPDTLERWSTTDRDGQVVGDRSALLTTLEGSP